MYGLSVAVFRKIAFNVPSLVALEDTVHCNLEVVAEVDMMVVADHHMVMEVTEDSMA